MTGIVKTTEKNLMVFSGRANPELAEEVASLLGTQLVPTEYRTFASGDSPRARRCRRLSTCGIQERHSNGRPPSIRAGSGCGSSSNPTRTSARCMRLQAVWKG